MKTERELTGKKTQNRVACQTAPHIPSPRNERSRMRCRVAKAHHVPKECPMMIQGSESCDTILPRQLSVAAFLCSKRGFSGQK